jgi:hypothetical protein
MNTFMKDPDNPAALAGCVLWLFLLAGLMALLFTGLSRIAG